MTERLWAGWRTAYVAASGSVAGTGTGTVFERILASGLPDERTYIVWRGAECFAILNIHPYTNGHVLILPYAARLDLASLTAAESDELWDGARLAAAAVQVAYAPDGLNIGINQGVAAGAGVPDHLHLHVVPRWSGDTNFITTLAETRVLPESLADSWRKLREAWPERT